MKTLILGAGLSGLSVASNLSLNYQVIEKSDKCGGLCRSSRVDGFTFDRAGHVLHFKDKANLRYVEKSLGLKLKAYGRDSGVWVGDRIIDYPYQHNFLDTGSSVADECLEGFKDALRNRRVRRPKNFRSWIIDNFGNGIARHFMFPYNDKFWLFPLNDMDSSWADALVPVPLLSDLETQRSRTGVGYNARFWYPVSGGIQSLIGVLEKRVRNIRRRCKAKEIDLVKKEVKFDDGTKTCFKNIISTIPLPELGKILKPLPDKVGDAFAMLKHVSVLSVNIGIKGEAAYGRHWIYFPQKEIAFYRMGIASNFCHSLAPRGFSSLCFEISYPGGSILRRSSILGKILSGCRKAGFMLGEKDIEVLDMQDIEYAYCIYDQRRAAALKTISGYLAKYGIYLAGRYGGWQYLSMEDCMVQAKEIARKVGG